MGHRQNLTYAGVCSLLLAGLSGCTWLIPDDPSALRYNSVLGERRAPQGNSVRATPPVQAPEAYVAAPLPPEPVMQAMPAPVPEVAVSTLSPMPLSAPPSVTMPGLPPVDALTMARAERELARQVPMENAMYEMAQSSFSSVPERPVTTGSDAPLPRMNNVRRDLEDERARAAAAREQLLRDAAAEPSMLPSVNAPGTTIPNAPEAWNAPASPTGYIALPPPPPMGLMGEAAAPEMLASIPQGDAPIQLRPPGSQLPSTVVVQDVYPPLNTPAPVAGFGGFDPLAVQASPSMASPQRYGTSNSFMPPSRYAARR